MNWFGFLTVNLNELILDLQDLCSSQVAQRLKHLPAMQETWVLSLDWEDTLEKEKATHSSILVWSISMDRGAWPATVHGVTKSQTRPSTRTHTQQ